MMKYYFTFFISFFAVQAFSQQATYAIPGQDSTTVVVHKDPRIDLLVKKQIQINEVTTREARKYVKGFRILVINTNKQEDALAAKSKIYTYFPELKPYLDYQSPYFRLKVGNFKERKEAESYKTKLSSYFPSGVFVINDIIEIKLDKPGDSDEN